MDKKKGDVMKHKIECYSGLLCDVKSFVIRLECAYVQDHTRLH